MIGRIPLAATAPAVPLLAAIALWAECARTIVIMDGSGLDVGQIEGRTKLEIARETAAEVLGAKLVEATFRADTSRLELGVVWSAVPVPGQDLPPEAWAKQEPVYGPLNELFRVRITPTGPNDFLIPTCAALSPAGEGPGSLEEGYACPGPDDCFIDDPTGLSFVLPAGWTSDLPFLAETAGGVAASAPTVTFTGPDGQLLLLNPIRWIEINGTCSRTAVGEFCMFGAPDGVALTAYATIMPSIAYQPWSRRRKPRGQSLTCERTA